MLDLLDTSSVVPFILPHFLPFLRLRSVTVASHLCIFGFASQLVGFRPPQPPGWVSAPPSQLDGFRPPVRVLGFGPLASWLSFGPPASWLGFGPSQPAWATKSKCISTRSIYLRLAHDVDDGGGGGGECPGPKTGNTSVSGPRNRYNTSSRQTIGARLKPMIQTYVFVYVYCMVNSVHTLA